MYSNEFEDAFASFLDRHEYDEAENYLFSMVHHRSVNLILHNQARSKAEARFLESVEEMLDETDTIQLHELQQRIKEALAELPNTYREAFMLHRFGNKSYKEIAELLQVSPKTVDYRIQQALKQLRILLKDYSPLLIWLIGENNSSSVAVPLR